jgi:hypothetical protein
MGKEILLLDPPRFWTSDGGDIIRNLPGDLLVTYRDIRSHQKDTDHSIYVYIRHIKELTENDGGIPPAPRPMNPAYDFDAICHPYQPSQPTESPLLKSE